MSTPQDFINEALDTKRLEDIEKRQANEEYQAELKNSKSSWIHLILNDVFMIADDFKLPLDVVIDDYQKDFIDEMNFKYSERLQNEQI